MKRTVSLLLAICLAISLSACSKKDTSKDTFAETASLNNAKEMRLIQETYSLPSGMKFLTAECVIGDRIYLGGVGEKSPILAYIKDDGSDSVFLSPSVNYEFVYSICQTDGGIAVLCGTYPYAYNTADGELIMNENPKGELSILTYDENDKLTSETPLSKKYTDEYMNFKLMLSEEDCFILLSESCLIKIGTDGTELSRIEQGDGKTFSSMCVYDEKIMVSRAEYSKEGSQISTLDAESFTLSEVMVMPDSTILGLGVSSDGRLIINDGKIAGGEVSYLNIQNQKTEKVFSWNELGMSQLNARSLAGLENGLLYFERYAESVCIAKFESVGKNRIELTLATDMMMSNLTDIIYNFNSKNDDYKIKVVQYGTPDRSMDLLRTEIISGKAPDIYAFSYETLSDIESSGAFEDLLPYLDKDPEYNRDTLVPSILKASMRNGKMYWLPYEFEIHTFIAPESIVGKKAGISMNEAKSFAAKMGSDVSVFPYWMSKGILLGWVTSFSISKFIDKEAGTCNFENPEFIALLEQCNAQREDQPEGTGAPVDMEAKSLLKLEPIQNLGVCTERLPAYKDNYTYVGFPTDDGNGSMFFFQLRFAMSSQSKQKDGVWEFIRSSMSEKNQQAAQSLPAVQVELDKQIKKALAGEYESFMGEKLKLKQEDADKLLALINGTTEVSGNNKTLYDIINEEAGAYFAGDTTAEEAAAKIQSRASVYLAEKK